MVRHGYTGCAPCHDDPSGGGILSAYGRSVGGLVMRTRYGEAPDEPAPADDFLLGSAELPAWLDLGGDVRGLWLASKVEGARTRHDWFLMQADLEAAAHVKSIIASASVGFAQTGGFGAAVTRAPKDNLVSRVHWAGYEFDETTGLIVRAGRMNLPFGIRNVEHTLFARVETGTGLDQDQQHGLAAAWSPGPFRAELMAILGNYQIRPDAYRERGYSGFLEWFPDKQLGLGASSRLTHRKLDPSYLRETWRQAHGLFLRWASGFEPLVILAEGDYVFRAPKGDYHRKGTVAYLQSDLEAVQGLHVLLTGEADHVGVHGTPFSWGAWFSQAWFFAPHADVRVDNVYQSVADATGRTDVLTLLVQLHAYL